MREDDRELVSASELANLGYCERVVRFHWYRGRRPTPAQVAAQRRGLEAHQRFYEDSLRVAKASERKGRCFVATLVLGECTETKALRAFRDLYLRRSDAGRWCIAAYYRLSPRVCELLRTRPLMTRLARWALIPLARGAARAVQWRCEHE